MIRLRNAPLGALDRDREASQALVPVSRETMGRLTRLVDLLLAWQQTVNLIAPSTLDQIWTRHIADSLQLVSHLADAECVVDLGSGAGFPGLVIACAFPSGPPPEVHVVESDSRKASFLREAVRTLPAPAHVHAERIEAFAAKWRGHADVVTARALAPMPRLLEYAAPFLEKGAQGLFLKGQDVGAELTEAAKYWHVEAELLPSLTSSAGRIVLVKHAQRKRNRGGA